MLEVHSLSTAYGLRQVLHSISFELHPGEILGVIGPNGAGKTTLIRALSGLLPLKSGQVLVDGKSISGFDAAERARHIAVVPQARQLPPAFTAWEIVLLGRTPHLSWLGQTSKRDEAIVEQAMQRTHTSDLADRRVGELSGGEQQRVLLARALAQSAPILLMDEPTSHLDLQYQLSLLEQVRGLVHQDNLSVLVTLHDLNLVARFADRVALLVDGELKAIGKPAEVLAPDLLTAAYHVSLQVLGKTPGGYPVIVPTFQ